jgi:hypothetical protein
MRRSSPTLRSDSPVSFRDRSRSCLGAIPTGAGNLGSKAIQRAISGDAGKREIFDVRCGGCHDASTLVA